MSGRPLCVRQCAPDRKTRLWRATGVASMSVPPWYSHHPDVVQSIWAINCRHWIEGPPRMVVFQFRTVCKLDWRNARGRIRFHHLCHQCQIAHQRRPHTSVDPLFSASIVGNHVLSAQLQANPLAGRPLRRGCTFLLTMAPQTLELACLRQTMTER